MSHSSKHIGRDCPQWRAAGEFMAVGRRGAWREWTAADRTAPLREKLMSANQIFLVVDAGNPKAAFTTRGEMQAYLRRRLDTSTSS